MRARLLAQLNQVLQTRDSARGLIVSMPDVLFDFNKYTLKPEARERLAKVSGIVLAYPDLKLQIEGYTAKSQDDTLVYFNQVSDGYFETMGIQLVAGRDFNSHDTPESPRVAIINQTAAKRYFAGQNPIGKRFLFGDDKVYTEIIGVAHDAYNTDLNRIRDCFMYLPAKSTEPRFSLLIKNPDTAGTARLLRSAVAAIDPKLYFEVSTIDEYRRMQEMPSRALSLLSIGLGAFSLLLACSGIYGVVNYSANHRVKEIGIRMTLGAHPREVLRMMMRQSLRPVLIGTVAGLIAAAAVTRLLSSMLYGVSPFDAWTFAGVVLLIIGASFLATFSPARRATRVDPATALRHE